MIYSYDINSLLKCHLSTIVLYKIQLILIIAFNESLLYLSHDTKYFLFNFSLNLNNLLIVISHNTPPLIFYRGGDTNSLNYFFNITKVKRKRDFLVLCRDKSGLFFFSFLSLRVRKYNFTDVNQ